MYRIYIAFSDFPLSMIFIANSGALLFTAWKLSFLLTVDGRRRFFCLSTFFLIPSPFLTFFLDSSLLLKSFFHSTKAEARMDQTSIHDAREEALSSPSPGNPGIRITDDCRSFILRRAEMKHVYIVKKKDTGVVAIALPDTFSQDLDDVASREWVNCCVREYLERMRLFKKRFSSRGQFFIYLLLLTIIFVAAMWAVWPLWGFFY